MASTGSQPMEELDKSGENICSGRVVSRAKQLLKEVGPGLLGAAPHQLDGGVPGIENLLSLVSS